MNMGDNIITLSQSDEYFFKRGLRSYRKKELQKAAKYLEKAVQLNPAQGVYQCQLAVIYSDMTEYEDSNRLLQYILDEIDHTLYECYFFMANNYAYLGLFEKAAETVRYYLQNDPKGDFVNDAYDLLDLLQMEEEEDFNEPLGDDELIILYDKASYLKEKKRYQEAKATLQKLISDYPMYWPAQNELAYLLYLEGRTEEALDYTKKLLQGAHYLPAICQLAVLYHELGRETEAEKTAEALKSVLPMDEEHVYHIAMALCRVGCYEDSYRYFRRYLLRHECPEEDFFFQAGVAAYQTNRWRQAKKWWEHASKRLHPGAVTLLDMWNEGTLTPKEVNTVLTNKKVH